MTLTIWGRNNSINVQKVLWVCAETGVAYERIDAGLHFGRNREPEYLAMNPNGRIPTIVDGDFVLWESNSILRYVAGQYGAGTGLYPEALRPRVLVDRWLDWVVTTLTPADRDVFQGLVRTAPEKRDMAKLQKALTDNVAPLWRIIDERLATEKNIEGEAFTIADLCLGCYARRWFGYEALERPALPHLEAWYARVAERPGFQQHIAPPLT